MSEQKQYQILITEDLLDFLDHVNHAHYLALYENARWHQYKEFGYTPAHAKKEQLAPIVLDSHIKYRKEIKLGEKITIITEHLEYRGPLCTVKQSMINESGRKASVAQFTIALFDLERRQLTSPVGLWKKTTNSLIQRNIELKYSAKCEVL